MFKDIEREEVEEANIDLAAITAFCALILDVLEPKAKAVMRRVEQLNREGKRNWPSWCYVPSAIISEEIARYDPLLTPEQLGEQTMNLHATLSWMHQRTVIRFSESVLRRFEHASDKRNQQIPLATLLKLPAYGVFIESRDTLKIDGLDTAGQLVYLNYVEGQFPLLTVITFAIDPQSDRDQGVVTFIVPHVLPLAPGSYQEAIDHFVRPETPEEAAIDVDREDNARSASYLAKVFGLLAHLKIFETDLVERTLTETGEFAFSEDLCLIDVSEAPRHLH